MNTNSAYIDTIMVVIVLYQTELNDSKSYHSISNEFKRHLQKGQQVDVIIINNGPVPILCPADDEAIRFHFVELLDNPGVSKAYNVAGCLAKELGKQWMLLLDQDTQLPSDFWLHYAQSIRQHPDLVVHAPRLYDGTNLASPCGYRFYRGFTLQKVNPGETGMKGKNVLNSGLLINVDAFWKVGGYDESVGLYFSDFVFFDRLKGYYTSFAIVDVDLAHDLSSSDYSNQNIALYRFYLYCKGAHAASRGNYFKTILYLSTVGARSLLMDMRFNTFQFSKVLLKTWLQKE